MSVSEQLYKFIGRIPSHTKTYGKQQDKRKWQCRSTEDAGVDQHHQAGLKMEPTGEENEAKEQLATVNGGGDGRGRLQLAVV